MFGMLPGITDSMLMFRSCSAESHDMLILWARCMQSLTTGVRDQDSSCPRGPRSVAECRRTPPRPHDDVSRAGPLSEVDHGAILADTH